jgi:multidrug resistance efflux pump
MGGQYITVSHNGQTYYNNTSQPAAGMLRYHSGGRVEVYDGSSWITVSGSANITLNPVAEQAITWAIQKQREEQELEKLSQNHPAIQAALENLRRAEEQLKTTIILSKDEQTTTS